MSDRTEVAAHAAVVLVVLAAALYGITLAAAPAPGIRPTAQGPAGPVVPPPGALPTPPSGSPAAAASPSAAATRAAPAPTPTRRPLVTRPYTYVGHAYTGVVLGTGWTIVAPFDARVEQHVYQLVGGQIREGSGAAGIPSYPYLILYAADGRRLTYRPGALDTDTKILVQADQVKAGDGLFTVIGSGASSWHDFYDASVAYQIVVSLVSADGSDLDATPLIAAR